MPAELRPEPALPDAAVVVVGGLMALPTMRRAVERSIEEVGQPSPSMSSWSSFTDRDAVGIVRAAQEVSEGSLNHTKIRKSTAGRIRAAGFRLVPTDEPGHYSLMLPDPATDADLVALEGAFDQPQENPAAGG